MIDLEEVQSTVVRPSRAPSVELTFVTFPDRDGLAAFLRVASEVVTSAAKAVERVSRLGGDRRFDAVNVGLTADGVRLAGVAPREWNALPSPFTSGMRAAAPRLGDVDLSAPDAWVAPFDGRTVVHAAVLRYGDATLGRLADVLPPGPWPTWRGRRLPGAKEPFGFRDGISDPVIEGSGTTVTDGNGVWEDGPGRWRAVRSGEAVLGHVDESGAVSGHPDAAQVEVDGSYLVVRKLEQDVDGFWRECATWAAELGGGVTAEEVAAQLVGRRPDGTVLGRDGPDPGNDFLYRRPGGVGRAVPPSSHIRRANPRDDTTVPGDLVHRHLLFRRGYPYEDEDGTKGLLFMACCADLARQFEFVQARWMQDGVRFDLGSERDPLIGQRTENPSPANVVSIDRDGVRVRRALPTFVHTRGGEYLLLPSRSALALLGRER